MWLFIARPLTPAQITERIFESVERGRSFVEGFQRLLVDEHGLVLLNGSLLTGFCCNPRSQFFGHPIDVGRMSDVDLAVVDVFYFSQLPQNHIIHKKGLAEDALLGNISHGFYDSTTFLPKKIMERTVFKPFRELLEELFELTGRFIDFKIFRDKEVLRVLNRPFYVLADKQRQYF